VKATAVGQVVCQVPLANLNTQVVAVVVVVPVPQGGTALVVPGTCHAMEEMVGTVLQVLTVVHL
jgi:predicted lipoprotein